DKMGQRPFITAAALLCGIGWSSIGFATSLRELYIFYAMAGIGASFVYGGSIGSALKWVSHRPGFASGGISARYLGGAALSVWMMQHLIHDYSYQTAFLVSGVIQGIVIGVIAQVLRHPGSDFVPPKPAVSAVTTTARPTGENFRTGEMLRTHQFYIL